MTKSDHLVEDLLIRFIDDEISEPEAELVRSHLSSCRLCKSRFQQLTRVSSDLELLLNAGWPDAQTGRREALLYELGERETCMGGSRGSGRMRRFGWGMALAATLVMGVLFLPHKEWFGNGSKLAHMGSLSADLIEIDGETFVPLPYSNPDLATSSPHIVRMDIPVSSLADAGLVFEPISNQAAAPDRSVLADVLIGMDGEPLGVHVLTTE